MPDSVHPRDRANGDPAEDEEIARLVEAEKLHLLFARALYPLVSSVVKASLYVAIIWPAPSRPRIVLWWAAIALISTARLVGRARYLRRPRRVIDSPRLSRAAKLGALANGCAWGLAAYVVYVPGHLPSQLLLLLITALMIAGATAFSAPYYRSFVAFVVPAAAPLVVRLLLEPDWTHRIIGLAYLNFTVATIWMGWVNGRSWTEHIWLQFRLALLTETLESRVATRTAELRAALQAREEFLMVASHELCTPVTSLRLATQFLEEVAGAAPPRHELPDNITRNLSTVVRQSQQLGRLIDDLLDVSRAGAGRLEIVRESGVDLAAAARAAAAPLQRELERTGSTLNIDAPLPVLGPWNRQRLEQVVRNLLANAIKFGEGKLITVTVSSAGEQARLSVSDQGIGIPAAQQPRIFDRFQRAVSAQHYGGLGLGLYLVRYVVEALGGTVAVTSAPGQGATFTVCLPRG
jgi:signal transduction histidine kinase